MTVLLVDADPVCYRAGFAAEKHSYHLVYCTDKSDLQEIKFSPTDKASAGDQMKAWIDTFQDDDLLEILDKTKIVTPMPLAFALEATRTQIQSIIKECGADHVRLFLSGKANYRYAVAKQRPYKGNRVADKPVHYDAIREYLSEFWNAELVNKIEADDKLSILAREAGAEGHTILATIDKDLDQIPGKHYNYMKQVFYDVDPVEAELFFYQQCLSGDPTDNIPGCYKVGNVGAQKIVYDAFGEAQEFGDVWSAVLNTYALSKEREGCPYAERDSRDVALETARLVKLQEYDGQLWTPPGEPLETVGEALYERS